MFVIGAAAVTNANHWWGGYHWARISNPFTLKLGDNVTSSWDAYLSETSTDWSVSSVLDTTIVPGTALRHRSPNLDCSPVNGTVQVCNKGYGKNGWLGLASIWISGSHITQGTAKMNDTYFNKSPYNTAPWRRLVMCQEIAHTFGLDHQDETSNNANLGSCMDYTNDPDGGAGGASATDPSNEHPNAHDYEQLETMYNGHLDGSTTVGQSVASRGNDVNHDDSNSWGREVRKSRDGHSSLFERDLGHGKKVFTFVFWAE